MFCFDVDVKVYVYCDVVDFCKGIVGLLMMVEYVLGLDLFV